MTLRDLFIHWCEVHAYFPGATAYIRGTLPLEPQTARLVRLHSHIDEDQGHAQHYILEARNGVSDIVFPLGQERRDIIAMESALKRSLKI